MKNFIVENWFKLVLSVCLLICSVGFLMQSSKPVQGQAAGARAESLVDIKDNGFYILWSDGTVRKYQ